MVLLWICLADYKNTQIAILAAVQKAHRAILTILYIFVLSISSMINSSCFFLSIANWASIFFCNLAFSFSNSISTFWLISSLVESSVFGSFSGLSEFGAFFSISVFLFFFLGDCALNSSKSMKSGFGRMSSPSRC